MKAILEVIKYEGDDNLLVWKHPAEDFNTHSKLIVREGQVAVFFNNGEVADVFEAGRHDLHTGNIPILRKLLELPYGGTSSFHCQVFFVNLSEAMDIKWGLPSRATWLDPVYGIKVNIGARGNLSISVSNAKDMLIRLVGADTSLTPEGLTKYFRDLMTMHIKSYLSQTVKSEKISVFDLDENMERISNVIKEMMKAEYAEYGFSLKMFSIAEFVYPTDDPAYIRLLEAISERTTGVTEAETARIKANIAATASAEAEVIRGRGRAEALAALGTSHIQERQLDIAENMSLNESMNQYSGLAGSMAMMGGAMNLGVQAASAIGNAMNPAVPNQMGMGQSTILGQGNVNPTSNMGQGVGNQPSNFGQGMVTQTANGTKHCPKCGTQLPLEARFCFQCSEPQPRVCINCGKALPEGANFCMFCGQHV